MRTEILKDIFEAQNKLDGKATRYEKALQEIRMGKKTSHWVWYIFPQIQLGSTELSIRYSIKNFNDACEYLQDPDLFSRYDQMVDEVYTYISKGNPPNDVSSLMSDDDKKLISSLTLFEGVARHLASIQQSEERSEAIIENDQNHYQLLSNKCEQILNAIAKKRNIRTGMIRCPYTLKFLNTHINESAKDTYISKTISKKKKHISNNENISIVALQAYYEMRKQKYESRQLSNFFKDTVGGYKICAADKLLKILKNASTGETFSKEELSCLLEKSFWQQGTSTLRKVVSTTLSDEVVKQLDQKLANMKLDKETITKSDLFLKAPQHGAGEFPVSP